MKEFIGCNHGGDFVDGPIFPEKWLCPNCAKLVKRVLDRISHSPSDGPAILAEKVIEKVWGEDA